MNRPRMALVGSLMLASLCLAGVSTALAQQPTTTPATPTTTVVEPRDPSPQPSAVAPRAANTTGSASATGAAGTQPTTASAAQRYAVRYVLADGHEQWPADKKRAIVEAMDAAVALYNELGEFDKLLTVRYSPDTPTADANYNGQIRFGGQIGARTALHEIGHALGAGTQRRWGRLLRDGVWRGPHATALVRAFDGPDAVLRGDRMHFWPYGLNFDTEDSPTNRIRHVLLVAALRKDMGIENGRE